MEINSLSSLFSGDTGRFRARQNDSPGDLFLPSSSTLRGEVSPSKPLFVESPDLAPWLDLVSRLAAFVEGSGEEKAISPAMSALLARALSGYSIDTLSNLEKSGLKIKILDHRKRPPGGYPGGKDEWGSDRVQGYYNSRKKLIALKEENFTNSSLEKFAIRSTRHELGHAIDDMLSPDGFSPCYHSLKDPHSRELYKDYMSRTAKDPSLLWSRYAKKNNKEYIAEGFEFYLGTQKMKDKLAKLDLRLYSHIEDMLERSRDPGLPERQSLSFIKKIFDLAETILTGNGSMLLSPVDCFNLSPSENLAIPPETSARTLALKSSLSIDDAARILEEDFKPLWKLPTGSPYPTSCCVDADGTVFLGSGRDLVAVKEGKEVWRFSTGGEIKKEISLGKDGTVFAGSADGHLYGLKDGKKIWDYDMEGSISSPPLAAPDGTVYVAGSKGAIHGLRDGKKVCEISLPVSSLPSSLSFGPDGALYITATESSFFASDSTGKLFACKDGKRMWEVSLPDRIHAAPAIDSAGTVYVTDVRGALYACGKDEKSWFRKGKIIWKFIPENVPDGPCPPECAVTSSPRLTPDGALIFGAGNGHLYAVKEGKKLWSFKTGSKINSSPCLGSDGIIYVGSYDKNVYAIKDGAKLWNYPVDTFINASPCEGPIDWQRFGDSDGILLHNLSTNQESYTAIPYSTCSSRSLYAFGLAAYVSLSSSPPSPSHSRSNGLNVLFENSLPNHAKWDL